MSVQDQYEACPTIYGASLQNKIFFVQKRRILFPEFPLVFITWVDTSQTTLKFKFSAVHVAAMVQNSWKRLSILDMINFCRPFFDTLILTQLAAPPPITHLVMYHFHSRWRIDGPAQGRQCSGQRGMQALPLRIRSFETSQFHGRFAI